MSISSELNSFFNKDKIPFSPCLLYTSIKLRISKNADVNITLEQIKTALQRHHGNVQVLIYLPDGRTLRTDSDLWGELSDSLRIQLMAILGNENVKMA